MTVAGSDPIVLPAGDLEASIDFNKKLDFGTIYVEGGADRGRSEGARLKMSDLEGNQIEFMTYPAVGFCTWTGGSESRPTGTRGPLVPSPRIGAEPETNGSGVSRS